MQTVDRIVEVLEEAGIDHVFGIPGRTSRTHSHKPLNLLTISFIEHIDLKNN